MAKKNKSRDVTSRRITQTNRPTSKPPKRKAVWHFPLGKENFVIFGVALVVIIVSFLLMATGIETDPVEYHNTWNNPLAISVAPILLAIAYCVLIPFGIMRRPKAVTQEPEQKSA